MEEPVRDALHRLAHNLRWSWEPEVERFFRDAGGGDPENPVAALSTIEALNAAARGRAHALVEDLDRYLDRRDTWADGVAHALRSRPVADFSAEFGLHASVRTYSGGLGVLAGDHLKSASDLGVPLVGVGLFYREGYFSQRLDGDGWQHDDYLAADPDRLPVAPLCNAHGAPIVISVDTREGSIRARVHRLAVGRVTLLLLDSDVDGNDPADRALTARLYGGDQRTRIRQELLLGVGGVRALRAAGIRPGAVHLNEGHSAFAALELVRVRMDEEGLAFEDACDRVARMTVFTTHTPVPAGHDRFPAQLMEAHLGPLREKLRIDADQLMALGRENPDDDGEPFCMTVLAIQLSEWRNGVSALHGVVSRRMWRDLWEDREEHEVPIGHVTNGVHARTWTATLMRDLYDVALGRGWDERQADPETWRPIVDLADERLWSTRIALKEELIEYVRERGVMQCQRRNDPPEAVDIARNALRSDALLIGFARRFATYKRATLLLQDLDALDRLINDPTRPVQIVFAGKAHPHDDGGKALIQHIFRVSREPRFAGKVVFLEDYDIEVGARMVSGVDVWLNNPRRPLEASGTSGQKVVLNGGLNCSVLDGWWAEAHDGENGFAIGEGLDHTDPEVQDRRDSEALHRVLTEEVVPLFFERDDTGHPRRWLYRMKRSIRTLAWRFNADRMVMDYVENAYLPAAGLVHLKRGGPA